MFPRKDWKRTQPGRAVVLAARGGAAPVEELAVARPAAADVVGH